MLEQFSKTACYLIALVDWHIILVFIPSGVQNLFPTTVWVPHFFAYNIETQYLPLTWLNSGCLPLQLENCTIYSFTKEVWPSWNPFRIWSNLSNCRSISHQNGLRNAHDLSFPASGSWAIFGRHGGTRARWAFAFNTSVVVKLEDRTTGFCWSRSKPEGGGTKARQSGLMAS